MKGPSMNDVSRSTVPENSSMINGNFHFQSDGADETVGSTNRNMAQSDEEEPVCKSTLSQM